jgi:hypothetical protein
MATKLAKVFGVIFVIVGLLGLVPGGLGIVGEEGFFMTNLPHDLVHLVIGVILLWVAAKSPAKAATALVVFGVVYLLVAVLGFAIEGDVLGITLSDSDDWLHLVLGIVLLAVGLKGKNNATAPSPMM